MRRIAVISDIHADLGALEAVLAVIEREDLEVWCLGDVVGRGPDPVDCLKLAFAASEVMLLGNHEAYQLDPESHDEALTDYGRQQFLPTRALLAADERWPEQRERLSALSGEAFAPPKTLLVHASPADVLWGTIEQPADVYMLGRQLPEGLVVLHGHTHFQSYGLFDSRSGTLEFTAEQAKLRKGVVFESGVSFVNPGTVGLSKLPGRPIEWGVLELDEKGSPVRFDWRRTPRR